ncbi:hypothetical protein ES702_03310 [subsurface metagenome]
MTDKKSYRTKDGALVEENGNPNRLGHTTFVVSRGTVVHVEAPTIEIPPGLVPGDVTNPTEMSETLREEVHRALTASVYFHTDEDVERFFRTVPTAFTPITPVWTLDNFTIPALSTGHPQYRSRRGYMYPQMLARGTWPDHINTYPDLLNFFLGFEGGPFIGYGAALFYSTEVAGALRLYAGVAGQGGRTRPIITNLAPADWLTAKHYYSVNVNRNNVEFYIDGVLKAILVSSPFINDTVVSQNAQPYAVAITPHVPPVAMPGLIEVSFTTGVISTTEYIIDFPASHYRVWEGDPCPPRLYRLYEWETENLFVGKTIAAGSLTSHPFPLFGYTGKTVYFRANQAGDFDIEILLETGNWVIYAADAGGSTNSNYVANDLETFTIGAEAVLGRVVFDPDAYPCVVAEGEVILR